jgi:stage II sporulation protein D
MLPHLAVALRRFALIGLVAALVAPPAVATNVTPSAPRAVSGDSLTFYGHGYGHGVGMSQYGARGRALAGQTAAQILAHYYPGTTLGSVATTAPIRVLVLSNFKPTTTAPARFYGRKGPWTIDGASGTFPMDALLRVAPPVAPSTLWRLRVTAADGSLLLDRTSISGFRIRPASSAARLQVWSRPSTYDTYRGSVRVLLRSTGALTAINETTMDLYLRGVVPAEMPYTWPTEALRAQAIAARSYAARRLHPTTGSYDVTDTTSSQVYLGVLAEKSATTAAITATAGQVLRSGTAIANTVFHSDAGTGTENNENVWTSATGAIVGGPVSYLRGSPDRNSSGTPYDTGAPHATWRTATYTLEQLSGFFAADPRTAVGDLTSIDLSRRGVSGRLISVTLMGSAGMKTVSGEVFRSTFNATTPATDPAMWSTLFDVAPIP